MTTEDIEKRFRQWADPDAADQLGSGTVQGGHGNGGKCYMVQMFESHAYLHTLEEGRASKYGFRVGGYRPGYFPSEEKGRGYPVTDPNRELMSALAPFNVSIADLPELAKEIWGSRKGFTLAVGVRAREFGQKRLPVNKWLETLRGHPQMVQSLQRNHIYAFQNGNSLEGGTVLRLPNIKPIPGAETPRRIQIPAEVRDPATGEAVPT